MAVVPLEGPNAAWTADAMEKAFRRWGAPRHLITDRGVQFTSTAFGELLAHYAVKRRLGAVGKHGSIAVTERVIETLKYEWLRRVPLLKGFSHLSRLGSEFSLWYNAFRPHTALGGARPDDLYFSHPFKPPGKTDKLVPPSVRRHRFTESGVTAYFLEDCA